eukprot:m.100790 g.100790  ORF g.100790 m.100790 type:complete len:697 (-) comp13183_c0_seq3:4403-6493(-)
MTADHGEFEDSAVLESHQSIRRFGLPRRLRKQKAAIKAVSLIAVLAGTLAVVALSSTLSGKRTRTNTPSSSQAQAGLFDSHPSHSNGTGTWLSDPPFGKSDGNHSDWPSNIHNQSCSDFKRWNDTCKFVSVVDDCQPDGGFINYLKLPYCALDSAGGGIAIMVVWLIFLFIALGITAEEFFCPALSVISDTLKLSHNVAGVTFLALGNGAPDMFSVYSSINNVQDGIQLALGALFGAGMFVTTVVVGTVGFVVPFTLTRRPFLRDVIAYLIAVSWTYVILWRGEIKLWEAIGFIVLYVIYVLVVVIGRKIYQSRKKRRNPSIKDTDVIEESLPMAEKRLTANSEEMVDDPLHVQRDDPHSLAEGLDTVEALGVAALLGSEYDDRGRHTVATTGVEHDVEEEDSDDDAPLLKRSSMLTRPKPWIEVFQAMVPFSKEDFSEANWFNKMYLILSAPITVALTITTPVVDFEEQGENWRQYLTMIQCVVSPLFFVFGSGLGMNMIADTYPVWLLSIMIGGVISLFVWCTTRASEPPSFHAAFAFMGFLVAVIWIYIIANEIVNLLQALGRMIGISDAILGLTVLAWGNSIGDFVSNITVAKQGFPQMAAGACFGGPALNVFLGIGISCLVATMKNGGSFPVNDQDNHQLAVSGGFLILALVSSLVIIPARKFNANKVYGIYLWVLYVAYLIAALVLEFVF